jgi:Glycosyltransferase family 87
MRAISPLVTPRGLLAGAWAALLACLPLLAVLALTPGDPAHGGLFNDFYDYWAAARILGMGGDPYDHVLVAAVLGAARVHSLVGGYGYSYPLLLAELLRPLAMLPALPAAVLFTGGSLIALALTVALLWAPPAPALPRMLLLATAIGLFAPVTGSLLVGQVNLYLLPALALTARGVARPGALAVASAVKLYPIAALAAFASLGRRGWRPLVLASSGAVALAVGPNLLAQRWSYGQSLVHMLGPDPYWTNQSVNGWLSRLALPSDFTAPPLPGLPVTACIVATCAGIGLLCAGRALRRRTAWPGAFAVLLCFGVVAAPKNSLWNFAPLVVAAACGLAPGRRRRWALMPTVAAWTLIEMGGPLLLGASHLGGHPVLLAWLSGLPLLGALILLGQLLLGTSASPAASVGHEIEWPEPAPHAAGDLRRSMVQRDRLPRLRQRPDHLPR